MDVPVGAVITVVLFLLGQTCAAVWWASKISAKVEYMAATLAEATATIKALSADRFTRADAEKCQAASCARMDRLEERVRVLETR